MGNIFIGFILVFLDFNLDTGSSRIGLIPDFIGYIYILKGLEQLDGESTFFMRIKPVVTGMAVYSVILYIMDLFGISVSLGLFTYVLAFVSIAISLYISYNIVMGVIDMEGKYNTTLNGERLKSTWTLLAVTNVLTFVLLLIPPIAIISIIASFIVAICFLVAYNNSKKLYYDIAR